MLKLYPLKFHPIFKEKIWGGSKLKSLLGKNFSPLPNCGETWEISGVKGEESKVSEGHLMNKTLPEVLAIYKEALVGEKTYKKFNNEFPLLIKFIDANDDLSIQVHPDDTLGMKRHQSYGKTEMWYILQADKGARLNSGFNRPLDETTYLEYLNKNKLEEILNFEEVNAGDVFFLPAGRVHYIGRGICLAEIQQTSDITYRIYDFDRKDNNGNKRELHTDLALEAIDYAYHENYKTEYIPKNNEPSLLVTCDYFTTNLIEFNQSVSRDYTSLDSFVIYIVLEGTLELTFEHGVTDGKKGDCILLPAEFKKIDLTAHGSCKLLEVYID